MADDMGLEIVRVFDICNNALRASIKCTKEGQKPCETCRFIKECKAAKEAIDGLWKEKEL
jgi:hypothetical protein